MIRKLWNKYREIIMYLIFGVATTFVGWVVYFAVFWSWRSALGIEANDTTNLLYIVGYTIAQIVQWIAAVLFAFFTNRKWVFTDAQKENHIGRQLVTFAVGRLATFGLDYVITYFGGMALNAMLPNFTHMEIFQKEWNLCDVLAKVVAAIVVIIGNYIFSKLFVFKNEKKEEVTQKSEEEI